ncbi:MAG TPA: magnesium transporter [Gemmatimonadales bacterium]|jgi:magnesium transporter|nr:magnesium transporter [Gemmatimonadales bacterium]
MSALPAPPSPELLYLLAGDAEDLLAACENLRPADVAEALNQLPVEAAARVVAALPFNLAVQLLDEPELDRRGEIFERLDEQTAVPLIEAISSDQQVELFRTLREADRTRLFHLLDAPTRDALKLLLAYPPSSAGGIMSTEFVGVPSTWTVDQVKRHISEVGEAKETVYAIYVLNPKDQRLETVVSLREIMLANPAYRVIAVSDSRRPVTVGPLTDREDVARLISKYNLLAIPVVDDGNHVLGIVTVDDVIDALISEQTEDVQKFGGMAATDEPYMQIRLGAMIRKRAGWLCALFLGEMLTAGAMGHFQAEISHAVVLALFIPLIISSGGNSGSQATSLIIRSMALREVQLKDWWRVAVRELPAGLALGAILGIIGLMRILLWQRLGWYDYGPHHVLIAQTVALALVGVVLFGSLAGSMLPFVLRRIGFDPASASAPFVATLVDVTGLVIYFSVALLVLRGTLL